MSRCHISFRLLFPPICSLFWILLAPSGFAQVLPFHTYTVRNGLISNAVSAMLQDSRGYLWIGTTDGISVYDGTFFRNYSSSDGLAFGHVNDFSESRRFPGTIWIATNGGGVSRFTDGSFRTYKTGDSPWSNRVNAVFEDFSGTVWCGADEGLFRIR